MRLIDADALVNALPSMDIDKDSKISKVGAIADFICIVASQPTINAIPVPCVANRYNPVCPIGKTDCVNDPAYAHFYHPEWYKEVYGDMTPDKVADKYCSPCVTNMCYCHDYDIEDK